MSSVTRTRYRVRKTENRAVALDRILGQGGREMVRETMAKLEDGTLGAKVDPAAASQYAWQRTRDADTHELLLTGPSLAQELRDGGVTELHVTLHTAANLATVSHRLSATLNSAQLSARINLAAERQANQVVNQVLALAVAQRLAVRLAEKPRVQQGVDLRIAQSHTIRAYAQIRG